MCMYYFFYLKLHVNLLWFKLKICEHLIIFVNFAPGKIFNSQWNSIIISISECMS